MEAGEVQGNGVAAAYAGGAATVATVTAHAAARASRGMLVTWPAVEGWDGLLRAGLLKRAGLLPQSRSGEELIAVIGSSRDRDDARALGCSEVMLIDGCSSRRREVAQRVRQAAAWLDEPLVIGDAMMYLAMASLDSGARLEQVDREVLKQAMSSPASADERSLQRAAVELTDDELCIVLLTSRAGAGDARMFTGLVGVMELDDHFVVGIASDRAGRGLRCARFSTAFRRWDTLLCVEPPAALLAAADVVLVVRGEQRANLGEGLDSGGYLSVLQAMVMGKPVVMVGSEDADAWLEGAAEAGTALVAKGATLPELARVIVPLMRSPELRAAMGAWCARRGRVLLAEGVGLEGW